MRCRSTRRIRPARVVIIEGDTLFAQLLSFQLVERHGHRVAAICSTVADGIKAIERTMPDLVITERTLPDGRGMDLVRASGTWSPRTRWLLLPAAAEARFVREASELGVHGFVMKRSGLQDLEKAIQAVLGGGISFCPQSSRLLQSEPALKPEARKARLTARESEVLHWIAEGKRNTEIAQILGNSQATVKSQVESILRKLQVETRGAAAAAWRKALP